MDGHARRFINHQKRLVLVDDIERQVLSLSAQFDRLWDTKFHRVSGSNAIAGPNVGTIDRHVTICDQSLQSAA